MPHVADAPEREQYELTVDGELAGRLEYHRRGGVLSLLHTVVEPAYEGRGLASVLVRAVLDDVRAQGGTVLPFCPYARSWLVKHPESLDLVAAEQRARFDLPAA